MRARWLARRVIDRAVPAIAAAAAAMALCQIAFAIFPWTGLIAAAEAVAAVGGVAAIALAARTIARRPSLFHTARLIEIRNPDLRPSLSAAIDLVRASAATPGPLAAAAIEQAASGCSRFRVDVGKVDKRRLAVAGACLGASAAILLCVNPRLADYRALPFAGAARPSADITPGSIAVPRNGAVQLRCSPRGAAFPSCELVMRRLDDGGVWRRYLRGDPAGSFSFRIDSARASFAYSFVLAGRAVNSDTVTAVPPPGLRELSLSLSPPAYTGRAPAGLPEGQGSFSAYAGTRVDVRLASVWPLARARICFAAGDSPALSTDGPAAHGSFRIGARRSGAYTFRLVDALGQQGDSLPSYYADLVPDEPPVVRIVKPSAGTALEPAQVETLQVEAVDDLGLRDVSLRYRTAGRDDAPGLRKLYDGGGTSAGAAFSWDLSALGLYPGDTTYFWALARDAAGQTAASETLWFRVPSFEEIHRRIAGQEEGARQSLENTRAGQTTVEEQLSGIVKSAKKSGDLSWEDKRIVRDIAEQMRAQRDSLSHAADALKQAVERLKQEGGLDRALIDKMEEVRRAVEDLVRAYGDSLLFEPPKPDERVAWNDLRDALTAAERMLPDLRERLDNTLRYLSMLKRDRELSLLAARAQDLAARQSALADSARAGRPADRLQRGAMSEERALADDLRAATAGEEPMADASGLPSLAPVDSLSRAMQESAQGPSPGQMQAMSGLLSSLSEELRSQLSTAQMARMEQEQRRLMDLSADAVGLSQWQHELRSSIDKTDGRNAQERAAALGAAQQALRGALAKSLSRLDSLSATPPPAREQVAQAFHGAASAMDSALAMLGRSQAGLPRLFGQAENRLNGAAQSLLDIMADMEAQRQGQGQGGMMGGLRRLSGRQAMVNAMTGEMLRRMLGGRRENNGANPEEGSGEGAEEARAASQQAQEEIGRRLRELADRYGRESGGDMEGRVRELEQEARRLADALRQPSPDVKDRQDRFLTRLLQAALSMHKQDEGKEDRKSASAPDVRLYESAPDRAALRKGADALYRARQEALRGNYPESYRPAVQAYFDSLEAAALR
jgi:polyhydroxyalkanoate synthesis regulator phasin